MYFLDVDYIRLLIYDVDKMLITKYFNFIK